MRALRVILAVASALQGCVGASAGDRGPEGAIRELAASLRAGSSSGADARERRALADELERAPLTRRAFVTLAPVEGDAQVAILVEEEGALRVEAGILGVPALDSPARAIAALHRALERELALGPGALLAEPERRAWVEERERYRDGTAAPSALDVRVEGDRAWTTTPLGDAIELVREGSEWRLASMRAAGLD